MDQLTFPKDGEEINPPAKGDTEYSTKVQKATVMTCTFSFNELSPYALWHYITNSHEQAM